MVPSRAAGWQCVPATWPPPGRAQQSAERLDAHERVPGVRVVHVPGPVRRSRRRCPRYRRRWPRRSPGPGRPARCPNPSRPGRRLGWGHPRRGRRSLPGDQIGPRPPLTSSAPGATVDPVVAPRRPRSDRSRPSPTIASSPLATADHVPTGRAPKDVVAVRAGDRAPGRAGGLERPSGDRARNDHRREDADDDGRAPAPVTRRCRRSPPSRGSARRSRRWRAW